MDEEKLKDAFSKIKEDILNLGKELSEIKLTLLDINQFMKQLNEDLILLKLEKLSKDTKETQEFHPTHTPTHPQKSPTHIQHPTDNPTHPQEIQGLNSPNLPFPTGNEGVPTDRQTDNPTDQQIHLAQEIHYLPTTSPPQKLSNPSIVVPITPQEKPIQQQISEASEILDSLDALKKDLRRKFKKITKQEMLVFSTIYTLEEQDPEGADYNKIAIKLALSQGSIRDYVHRMINKGIPITKDKLNNKKIILHISKELKRIATLNTIIKLREI